MENNNNNPQGQSQPSQNKPPPNVLSYSDGVYISIIVVLFVILIVTIPVLAVFLIRSNQNTLKQMFNFKLPLKLQNEDAEEQTNINIPQNVLTLASSSISSIATSTSFSLPFIIASNERLIVTISRSNSPYLTWYIYSYPVGTYTTLEDLVDALNTAENWQAIYYNVLNSTWFVNSSLYWSINATTGSLQFQWNNTFYDQYKFIDVAPLSNPLFHYSNGQGAINDVVNPPDVRTLPISLGLPINVLLNGDQPYPANFPS
jgi:hypothetical protein